MCNKRVKGVLFFILFLSLGLNLYGNNFPLGYHADEPGNILFILNDTQDFRVPILILQVVRLANIITQFESEQQLVVLGRITTAIFGTLTVLFIFKLAKQRLATQFALGAAFLTAVTPGMVVHSHYLKEDIAFACTTLLSFYHFFGFADQLMREKPDSEDKLPWHQLTMLGIAIGLTVSAKYQAAIVLFACVLTPAYVAKLRKFIYFKGLFSAFVIGFITFLLVNLPLFHNFSTFIGGLQFEFAHSLNGHSEIQIRPLEQFFTFHLRNGILPSFTLVPLTAALFFLVYTVVFWRKADWRDRFLTSFVIIFYLVIETSPLKPYPGYVRYVVILMPLLAYACFQTIRLIVERVPPQFRTISTNALTAIVIIFPLISSIKFDYFLNRDSRSQLPAIVATKQDPVVYEAYTTVGKALTKSLAGFDTGPNGENACTLVLSSFMYDRYLFGSSLKDQDPLVHAFAKGYLDFFAYPYTEVRPEYKSYAFSNPTLRIVDICPPPWQPDESKRLGSFLSNLQVAPDMPLYLVSPSPSPFKTITVDHAIEFVEGISYPDFVLIPKNDPLYYTVAAESEVLDYQLNLFEQIPESTFQKRDGAAISFLRSRQLTDSSIQTLPETNVNWKNESGWTLLGYDSEQNSEQMLMTTYWQIEALPEGHAEWYMTTFYQVFNSESHKLANVGEHGLWGYRVQVGDVLVERVAIPISAEWPTGTYTLSIGLYDPIHNINFFFKTADRPASYTFDFEIK